MPVIIRNTTNSEVLVELCPNSWELPYQLYELERWLEEGGQKLPSASYVADVGFSARDGAMGGGAVLSRAMMARLVALGIELWFSEYPPDGD